MEKLNLRRMELSLTNGGLNEHATNQANAFKFRHVYKVPLGETKKSVYISAKDDKGRLVSLSSTDVEINARYQFLMYSVILEFPDHLDSGLEQNSEVKADMSVKQGGDVFYNRGWKTESIRTNPSSTPGSQPVITWRLPNSNFSREIASLDENIEIDLNLSEQDGIDGSGSSILETGWAIITAPFKAAQWVYEAVPSGFDGSNRLNQTGMPLKIHPDTTIGSTLSNKATVVYEIGTREGRIIANFSYDLKLIVPANPASGPTPMNSMN